MLAAQTYSTSDISIRKPLIKQLNEDHPTDTAIIPELSLPYGSARIDLAVVNGIIHGYELKSDNDSLIRLKHQMETYNLIFDQMTLVVGKKHVVEALKVIPNWWGITIAKQITNEVSLLPIRQASSNPNQDLFLFTNLLWRQEAINILYKFTNKKGLQNKSKKYICEELVNTIEENTLKKQIRVHLRNRFLHTNWRSDEASKQYGG